jgi:acyl carrier protein
MPAPGTEGTADEYATAIKQYILDEYLPGEDPAELTPSTPLLSTGVIDSVGTISLMIFLEERFGVQVAAHEADAEHLDTIERIVQLVREKQASAK